MEPSPREPPGSGLDCFILCPVHGGREILYYDHRYRRFYCNSCLEELERNACLEDVNSLSSRVKETIDTKRAKRHLVGSLISVLEETEKELESGEEDMKQYGEKIKGFYTDDKEHKLIIKKDNERINHFIDLLMESKVIQDFAKEERDAGISGLKSLIRTEKKEALKSIKELRNSINYKKKWILRKRYEYNLYKRLSKIFSGSSPLPTDDRGKKIFDYMCARAALTLGIVEIISENVVLNTMSKDEINTTSKPNEKNVETEPWPTNDTLNGEQKGNTQSYNISYELDTSSTRTSSDGERSQDIVLFFCKKPDFGTIIDEISDELNHLKLTNESNSKKFSCINLSENENSDNANLEKIYYDIDKVLNQEEILIKIQGRNHKLYKTTEETLSSQVIIYKPVKLTVSGGLTPRGYYPNAKIFKQMLFVFYGSPNLMYAINLGYCQRDGCPLREIVFGNMRFAFADFGYYNNKLYIFTNKGLYTLDLCREEDIKSFEKMCKTRLKKVRYENGEEVDVKLFLDGVDTQIYGRNVFMYADQQKKLCYYEYEYNKIVKTGVGNVFHVISVAKALTLFSFPIVIRDEKIFTIDIDHSAYITPTPVNLTKGVSRYGGSILDITQCILPPSKVANYEDALYFAENFILFEGNFIRPNFRFGGNHSLIRLRDDIYIAYIAEDYSSPCCWQFLKIKFFKTRDENDINEKYKKR